ncbi:trypsin-like serine peptidase [Flavobacterium poyangense]|uniref:trypsin-like serine peptidase n=1 Tax=Flavobacterium poyangense TaxID=2204302 RepID=UPI00141EA072|nr:hypothetical protein [Flavobacterium sp. JXAS1]
MKDILFLLFLLMPQLFYSQDTNCELIDTRTRIVENNIPNMYTCYMVMNRGGSERYGTGFLIHPRVILSAGHNFAWYPNGSVNTVKVFFGSIDSSNYAISDTITLNNTNRFFKSGYWAKGKIYRDYSVVILPDSTVYKKVKGIFKLPKPNKINDFKTLNITGSPGDKDFFEMWTANTVNFNIQSDKITYDLFTEVRNSGSPVWSEKDGVYYALGVHSRKWGDCNAAVFLNEEVQQQIRAWCKEGGIILD